MNKWTKLQILLIIPQIICLIIQIATWNNWWLIGSVGLIIPNLIAGFLSIRERQKEQPK